MTTENKSFPMTQWTNELNRLGLVSDEDTCRLNAYDADKVSRLNYLNKTIGLPIDIYLSFEGTSFTRDNAELGEFFSRNSDAVFSLRAEPIRTRSDVKLSTARGHGLNQAAVYELVEGLGEYIEDYRIRLCVYFIPDISGHIVISDSEIEVEATRGRLMGISQQWCESKDLVHARMKFPCATMKYSTDDVKIREVLWQAVKQTFVNKSCPISIHHLPASHRGYYEFVFSHRHGFRFVDFNQSSLFCDEANSARLDEVPRLPLKLRPPRIKC